MSTKMGSILKSLSQRDIDALKSIYDLRCLTINQVYELHYMKSVRSDSEIVSDSYCRKKINEFIELDIIERVEHIDEDVLFLTAMGVEIVRNSFDLPMNIYDPSKRIIKRGYYRASELKISNKYMGHQINLNQFMVEFMQKEYDVYWKYYDEKYISQFRRIRPDGLLSMLDTEFFLEMDMATESKKQLYGKWENYRRFLSSREFEFIERKIVVLFIIENTLNPQARIDLVKHTLSDRLLDMINPNFEIYVGTKSDMLKIIEDRVEISKRKKSDANDDISKAFASHGFSIALGEKLKEHFNGEEFDFYCRKMDEKKHISVENGKVQEYVVDSYKFSPFSVLKKISYLVQLNTAFRAKFDRALSYVVVGESEEQLYKDLKIMDMLVVDNVYYTTLDRLEEKTFHGALFQFDFFGNVHSFQNNGFQDRVFEYNIAELLMTKQINDYNK